MFGHINTQRIYVLLKDSVSKKVSHSFLSCTFFLCFNIQLSPLCTHVHADELDEDKEEEEEKHDDDESEEPEPPQLHLVQQ